VYLSVPILEELDCMTIQIGMLCAEGVLLVSDRKMTNLVGFRHGRLAPKIEVYENENIAHCSSGDGFCDTFTNVVRKEASKGATFAEGSFLEVKQALIECVHKARASEKEFRQTRSEMLGRKPLPECVGGNTLLVFRGDGVVTLWTVDTTPQYPNPVPIRIGERAVAGDTNSPAVFFLERYFHKVPSTIAGLIPLAVHTVLMAESVFVEGLEVGVFTQDIFRTLTDEELKPAIESSKKIDSYISKVIRLEAKK